MNETFMFFHRRVNFFFYFFFRLKYFSPEIIQIKLITNAENRKYDDFLWAEHEH